MKHISITALFLLLTLELFVTSCSTLIHGSKQTINIQSLTDNSKIYVDELEIGKDHVSVRLKRTKNHIITISKEGFKKKYINLNKEIVAGNIISDTFWAYLLLGSTGYGAAWIIIDASTGSWYSFKQETFVVELENLQKVDKYNGSPIDSIFTTPNLQTISN